jgi:5-enolpyruvylshikimate-3-phosphate synthase
MIKEKVDIARILNIPGSKSHALNAVALALKANKGMIIRNPYPKVELDKYSEILASRGFEAGFKGPDLILEKTEGDSEESRLAVLFDLDDPVALLAAMRFELPVKFLLEENEDFERRFLILRRFGVEFGSIQKLNNKNVITIEGFEPVKVKFSFQESNFYLANFAGMICALFDLETEFLSKIDVIKPLAEDLFPFNMSLEDLRKPVDDTDELEKRLRKLQKNRPEESFHFRVKGLSSELPEYISMPADPFMTALAVVIAAVDSKEEMVIGPLMGSEGEKTLAKMGSEGEKTLAKILTKFGLTCDINKHSDRNGTELHYFRIKSGKICGRKIEESLMRGFIKGFGPLALLASFADDKTILRGLPSSSSLWQSRISGVADILSTAGIRVGEVEDGFVIEPPQERADITYQNFDDPYLQLIQLAAGILINEKPLTAEFFQPISKYPHLKSILDKIRPRSKSLAS